MSWMRQGLTQFIQIQLFLISPPSSTAPPPTQWLSTARQLGMSHLPTRYNPIDAQRLIPGHRTPDKTMSPHQIHNRTGMQLRTRAACYQTAPLLIGPLSRQDLAAAAAAQENTQMAQCGRWRLHSCADEGFRDWYPAAPADRCSAADDRVVLDWQRDAVPAPPILPRPAGLSRQRRQHAGYGDIIAE